ncbi:hypothetical protein DEJ50_09030 [Streptomyces venezuelae]|uniref:Uncharacterized protein n=2 Tax=Streptomyces venezuelae TaxID=54571 RepID=A0A5P2D142_STRVZ|nr:hypothetical protein DEJ50_09030 [Streptomyces venezuelae]
MTYHEVMTTDFGQLTAAAAKWESMAGEFKKVEERYRDTVQKITMGGQTWTGVSAGAAHTNFAGTRYEYSAAQVQAKAIAGLLRDAHEQFTDLKKKVESARDDAVKAGMRVSEQGRCTFDFSKADAGTANAARHDPDLKNVENSWSQHIDSAVKAIDDADQGVKIALEAACADGYGQKNDVTLGTGFNGEAQGDVEVYEARNAEDIATRLAGGEKIPAAEMAELQRSFRDNSGKPEFSQVFINGLGAKGTIELTNRLNDQIHVKNPANKSDFTDLQKGLGATLASATQDPKSETYKKFRAEMQKEGLERRNTSFTDLRLEKAYGYQSLVTLMSQGGGDYSKQFLHDMGDDIMKAEKGREDIWVMKGDAYSGKDTGWFANDPMDGLLGVMSRDPEASASYLKDEDRMKHLLDRNWEVVLEAHEHGNSTHYSASLDGDERKGFAAALQAGATGIDPSSENPKFVKHSPDNVAVFNNIIGRFGEAGDEFPKSLREPMANILVNHGDTVHQVTSSVDMRSLPVEQNDLYEVIKQVSKDQDSYGALNYGINQAMVSDIHAAGQEHPSDSLLRAGRTVGFLEEARTAAVGPAETAAFDQKWMFDTAIGYIPVVSGEVQSGFDYVVEKWMVDEQKKLDQEHSDKSYESYKNRNGQLMALTEEWMKLHDKDASLFNYQDQMDEAALAGANRAKSVGG